MDSAIFFDPLYNSTLLIVPSGSDASIFTSTVAGAVKEDPLAEKAMETTGGLLM